MKNFLWYLAKWIVGTPIMALGGLLVILVGTIIILWGAAIVIISPIASVFAEITVEMLDDEVQDQG